jgi:transmembrane sensor
MSVEMEQRTVDEAAVWDARLRSHSCTEQEREEFQRWLKLDPHHQTAYDRLQQSLGMLRAASDHPRLRAMRELASLAERRAQTRRRITVTAVAAGIAAIALTIGITHSNWDEPQHDLTCMAGRAPAQEALGCEVLMTSAAERRVVVLRDSSSVTLSSSTRIETEWLAHERRVRLISGRVLFRVAKDTTRPFVVTAGDRSVTALGTAFDVRLDAQRVHVTLLEGRVAVHGIGSAASEPTVELNPDQQLVALTGQAATVQTVDGMQESAWAQGQVYFSDEPLPAAVAEMNQHSTLQVVIADPTLSAYRVNGMFRTDNQDGFVSAITSYFPIEARPDGAGRIVLRSRSQGDPLE